MMSLDLRSRSEVGGSPGPAQSFEFGRAGVALISARLGRDPEGYAVADELVAGLKDTIAKLKRVTHHQRLEAIALAYGLDAAAQIDPVYEQVVDRLVAPLNVARRKKLTRLRLILEATIEYGENEPGAARRLYSRDVAALKFAESVGIDPLNLVARAEDPGEGLDEWSKRWATAEKNRKLAARGATLPAPPELQAQTLEIKYMAPVPVLDGIPSLQIDQPAFAAALARLIKRYQSTPTPGEDPSNNSVVPDEPAAAADPALTDVTVQDDEPFAPSAQSSLPVDDSDAGRMPSAQLRNRVPTVSSLPIRAQPGAPGPVANSDCLSSAANHAPPCLQNAPMYYVQDNHSKKYLADPAYDDARHNLDYAVFLTPHWVFRQEDALCWSSADRAESFLKELTKGKDFLGGVARRRIKIAYKWPPA